MPAVHFARLAALSVLALAGFTAAAAAADIAYTTGAANLRSGPGTSYSVIATIPKNTRVVVEACTAARLPLSWLNSV